MDVTSVQFCLFLYGFIAYDRRGCPSFSSWTFLLYPRCLSFCLWKGISFVTHLSPSVSANTYCCEIFFLSFSLSLFLPISIFLDYFSLCFHMMYRRRQLCPSTCLCIGVFSVIFFFFSINVWSKSSIVTNKEYKVIIIFCQGKTTQQLWKLKICNRLNFEVLSLVVANGKFTVSSRLSFLKDFLLILLYESSLNIRHFYEF